MNKAGFAWRVLAATALLCVAAPAAATITLSPGGASRYPTQAVTVTATINRGGASLPVGVHPLTFTGLPSGVTTIPTTVTYTVLGATAITQVVVSFQFSVGGSAVAGGPFPIIVGDPTNSQSAPFSLTILEPFLRLSITTPTLTLGMSTANVFVRCQPDPGFGLNVPATGVPLIFSVDSVPLPPSTPANVTAGGRQFEIRPFNTTLSFPFSRTGPVVGGTYTVPVVAVWTGTDRLQKSASANLTLNIPDVSVLPPSFAPAVCNGGPAQAIPVVLTPQFGFNALVLIGVGTPPAGITMTPSATTVALPPAQTVNFSTQASGAALGNTSVPVRFFERAGLVDKIVNVPFRVIDPVITPSASPSTLTIQAGGAAGSFSVTASPPPAICGTAPIVDVTVLGLPTGFVVPGPTTINPPTYGPANIPISAAATVAPGSYPATLRFTPRSGPVRDVPATVVVTAGPDFSLAASPTSRTLLPGGSGQITFSLTPLNGFTGVADVTIPAIQDVTVNPATFRLTSSAPVNVTFTAAATARPATIPVTVVGTAAGIAGPRTVGITIVINSPPDYTLGASPPSLSLAPGASGTIRFTVNPLFGYAGTVTATVPTLPNVTATPASFTLGAGASQDVVFAVAAGTSPQTIPFTVTGVDRTVPPLTRQVSASIVVLPLPDFSLSVAPLAVGIVQGDTATIAVAVTGLNGFTGTARVAMPSVTGLTFVPSAFDLAAGATQPVQLATTASTPLGTSTVTLAATAAGVAGTKTASLSLTVNPRPDFVLEVVPNAVSIATGATATVAVSARGLNGFAGAILVTAPSISGVSFAPASFSLTPGGTQPVTVSLSGAAPGSYTGTFSGTSPGVSGSRTAGLTVGVAGSPDFSIVLTPASLEVPAGGTGTTSLLIGPLNGFTGAVGVTASGPAGATVTPSTFTVAAGATQVVTVTLPASPTGSLDVTFTGTSPSSPGPRTAVLRITLPTAPDFSLTATPPSLRVTPGASASITVGAAGFNGFSGAINVTATLPSGLTADPASFTLQPGATQVVNVTADAAAPAGFFTIVFNGSAPGVAGTRSVSVPTQVESRPDFTITVDPTQIDLPAGGRAPATVTLIPIGGWGDPVSVTVTGSTGVSVVPDAFTLAPSVPQAIEIRAADTAPAGPVTLVFLARGTSAGTGVTVTRTVNVQVSVAPPGDFNVRVTPPAPRGTAGRAIDLSLLLEPSGGFTGSANVTVLELPPGATLTPASPRLSANVPQAATLFVPRTTPAGSYTFAFRADEIVPPGRTARRPLAVSKTYRVPVEVLAPTGGFTVVASPAAVQAAPGQVIAVNYIFRNLGNEALRIVSDTFTRASATGTVFDSVEETVDLLLPPSGTLTYSNSVVATEEMFARAGTPPVVRADRTFRAVPDATGYVPTATAPVAITAVNPLLSTASATRLSVVFPLSGSLVARGENLRAQGLIFSTGSGLFLVGWYWDGLLVETATVAVQNGTPAAVTNSVTFPTLLGGSHEITLAVLMPNVIASPPVQVFVDDVGSSLKTVSPGAGSAFVPTLQPPTFSWVPVPGVSTYRVGLGRRGRPEELRWFDSTGTQWSPPAALWNRLPEGEYEWTVRGYSSTSRTLLDTQKGGVSVPPTGEGSPAVAEGWTVSSAPSRFAIGGFADRLAPLTGEVRAGAASVSLSWKPVDNALFLVFVFERSGGELRRLFVEMTKGTFLTIPLSRLPAGKTLAWRAMAIDAEGRPVASTPLIAFPQGGGR